MMMLCTSCIAYSDVNLRQKKKSNNDEEGIDSYLNTTLSRRIVNIRCSRQQKSLVLKCEVENTVKEFSNRVLQLLRELKSNNATPTQLQIDFWKLSYKSLQVEYDSKIVCCNLLPESNIEFGSTVVDKLLTLKKQLDKQEIIEFNARVWEFKKI